MGGGTNDVEGDAENMSLYPGPSRGFWWEEEEKRQYGVGMSRFGERIWGSGSTLVRG